MHTEVREAERDRLAARSRMNYDDFMKRAREMSAALREKAAVESGCSSREVVDAYDWVLEDPSKDRGKAAVTTGEVPSTSAERVRPGSSLDSKIPAGRSGNQGQQETI